MAILLYSTDDGHVPAWEFLPASGDITLEVGMGMAFGSDGTLTASAKPTHICMKDSEGMTTAGGDLVPVVRIAEDQVWESTLYTAATSAKVGNEVDLSANGKWVDATKTTNKNFRIEYLENTIRDSVVRGRFISATSASS